MQLKSPWNNHQIIDLKIFSFNFAGSLTGAMNSVVDLLYNLGTTEDADTKERLTAIIDWLYQSAVKQVNFKEVYY